MIQENRENGKQQHMRGTLKRLIDLVIAIPMLIITSPLFGFIALAIKLDDGGTVSFRQERIGQIGRVFRVWKFRTMIVDATKQGLGNTVAVDDERITRVGKLLRNFGLDELPQLLNVLLGNMSLVGPRPTLAYQVEHYNDFQRRRLEAKPGITSLAVVSGRNSLSWVERIKLDVWYVDHQSFGLDLKILFRTVWCVLVTREGLYGEDGVNDMFVPASEIVQSPGEGENSDEF
ncbi:sugar transferase [Candidatus Bipolaricaulota bacterium]